MLQRVHAQIMQQALDGTFGPRALKVMIAANLRQDDLGGQIGHDEFHFDNNAFAKSYAYIEAQRGSIQPALERGDSGSAWKAFGRLTHTAQDFYAHSNYVDLWLVCQPDGAVPLPGEIDPLDADLIGSPALRSGKWYLPFGALSLIPPLRPLVMPRLPRDSHAWMNLDSPAQGPHFEYAFQAAVKRTRHEFEVASQGLSSALLSIFKGTTYA
jgi:hypothetical protein